MRDQIQLRKEVLNTALKFAPTVMAAYQAESKATLKYIDENFSTAILNSVESFDNFMSGLKATGSGIYYLSKDIADVAIANSVKRDPAYKGDILNSYKAVRIANRASSEGLDLNEIKNSKTSALSADIKNSLDILNTVEAVADGTFGLNRIVTALSIVLPTVVRQKFLEFNPAPFANVSMGMSAYKNSIFRRGVEFVRPRPEEMLMAVGSEMKGATPSLSLNQIEIKVFQLVNGVTYNMTNVKLNEALNISVISELTNLAVDSFMDAFVRGLHYGITSQVDGSSFKGIQNYPDATVNTTIWAADIVDTDTADSFMDRLTSGWLANQATGSTIDKAMTMLPDTFVIEAETHSKLSRIALTSGDYPAGYSLLMYITDRIQDRFLSYAGGKPVSINVIPSAFSNAGRLEITEGTATPDRMYLYRKEDLFVDFTMIPTAGFNTADNYNMELVNVAFMSEPNFAYGTQSILLIGKGF